MRDTLTNDLAFWLWERLSPNYQGDKSPTNPKWELGAAAGLVRRDGAGYAVADAEALHAAATEHVREERLRPLATAPQALFDTAAAVGRVDYRTSRIEGRALAALHNEGTINLFRAAAATAPSTRRIFELLHVLEGAVPFLEIVHPDDVIELEKAYAKRVENDGARGCLRQKLRQRFESRPSEARAVIDRHLADPDARTAPIFVDALAGLSATDLSQALETALAAAAGPSEIRRPAVFALGQLTYGSSTSQLERAVACLHRILDDANDPASDDAIEPFARLATAGTIDASIFVRLARHGPMGRYEAANWAAFHGNDLPAKPWLADLLAAFALADPGMAGVMSNVDEALERLFKKDGMQDHVIATLEAWLDHQEARRDAPLDFAKQFESVVAEIANKARVMNRIVTKWLGADGWTRPLAARQLVQWLEVHRATSGLAFDLEALAHYSADDLVFLVRRTLSHVFARDPLISMILSLADLRDAETRAFGLVAEAFLWGPGYDYPDAALEALRARREGVAPDSRKAKLFDQLIEAIEDHEKALADLPERAELTPSYHKRRAVVRHHQRMNESILRGAEKQSIFSQFSTKIPLKAGKKTFGKQMGDFGNVMRLGEMSSEYPWPRSESTDPVGRAIQRHHYARAIRKQAK